MKIVCDSCGAKYSIADEKVAGRVFKIRCKKCGSAIVVRGDQSGAQAGAPAAFDYGGEAVWHVVVEGDQQGPLTPAQIGQMIADNTIAWDAYVWREGFDDWKPAQEIEELVQQIMSPGTPVEEPTTAVPSKDPFAASAVAASGADLFAQSDAGAFSGGASDEDDVVASAPSPRVSASQAMTGARNENSVLFSLSNLQALATGGNEGAAAPARVLSSPAPARAGGMATGEGSGLIDIRALAGAASSMSTHRTAEPARVDDLLSIGTATAGLGSGLGAPVIIPEKKDDSSGRGLLIGGALVAFSVLAGAGIIAYGMMSSQPDPAASGQIAAVSAGASAAGAISPGASGPVATTSAEEGVERAAEPGEQAAAPAAASTAAEEEDETEEEATEQASESEEEEDEEEEAADDEDGSSGRSSSHRSRRRSRSDSSSSSPSSSSSSPSSESSSGSSSPSNSSGSSASGSSRRSGGGGGDDIDALLNSALRGGGNSRSGRAEPAAAPAEQLPESPGRDDVINAMRRVSGAVGQCGGGQSGTATVQVVVAGRTGRVSNATVGGQFQGTPVASCIARAVRGATFPRFSRPNFSFEYPFRI